MSIINLKGFIEYINEQFDDRKKYLLANEENLNEDPIEGIIAMHIHDTAQKNFINNFNKEFFDKAFDSVNDSINLFLNDLSNFHLLKKDSNLKNSFILFSKSHEKEILITFDARSSRKDLSLSYVDFKTHSESGNVNRVSKFNLYTDRDFFSELKKSFLDLTKINTEVSSNNKINIFEKKLFSGYLYDQLHGFQSSLDQRPEMNDFYNFFNNFNKEIINIAQYDKKDEMINLLIDSGINQNNFLKSLDLLKIQYDYISILNEDIIPKNNLNNKPRI